MLALAVAIPVASCGTAQVSGRSATVDPCLLSAEPTVIDVEDPIPGELHEVYDLIDVPALWGRAPEDAEEGRYRNELAAHLPGLGPQVLLERQRRVYGAMAVTTVARDLANMTAVADQRVGETRPATCLERLLFRRQARRYPMVAHPTEFGAFVLRRDDRLRVYLSGADRVGQRIRGVVTDRVQEDVAAGFELLAHLHNHPFLLNRTVGDRMWTTEGNIDDVGGALAPSSNDVQFYRRLQERFALQGAWITNGLDTAHFAAADFAVLAAAD